LKNCGGGAIGFKLGENFDCWLLKAWTRCSWSAAGKCSTSVCGFCRVERATEQRGDLEHADGICSVKKRIEEIESSTREEKERGATWALGWVNGHGGNGRA
jgi:hypothetical protein